jgi:amino acid transporter
MPNEKGSEGLLRVVGMKAVATSVVNFTIGAGIFALPAIVGIQMGATGILGYLFCSLMLATIMLCYAEIGSRITTSGGSYAYVDAAFGPFAAFVINWLIFFGWGVLGSAALMNIIADSLSVLFPVFTNSAMRGLFFFILLSLMVLVNIRSSKISVRFVSVITVIKLVPLFAIIFFGFSHIQPANLHWEQLPSITTLGNTALILFFAFAGFETALNVSGEIKNPERNIPMGILLGGILVLVLYILLQTVTQGVLGGQLAAFKDAPLAAVAEKIIGPVGGTILLLTAAVSCFGSVGGDVLASSRLLFAGAKDGLFPSFLAKVHPRFTTPHLAVITYAAFIFFFSISGGFKQLAVLASSAILIIYLAVILATIRLRMKKEIVAEKTFRAPGGLIIPFVGIASILWLLSHLTMPEILATCLFIGIICLIYFSMKKLGKTAFPTGADVLPGRAKKPGL